MAGTLKIADEAAFVAIRYVHGKVDLARRAEVGTAGEDALIRFLEMRWPGSTIHVAQDDDSFGYDIVFWNDKMEWHLEVKATNRRGRLVIHLSRHEHEMSLRDARWRLIVVGLDEKLQLRALATVRHPRLSARAPKDLCAESRWQSTSHQLTSNDLDPGLSFLDHPLARKDFLPSREEDAERNSGFAWMPQIL